MSNLKKDIIRGAGIMSVLTYIFTMGFCNIIRFSYSVSNIIAGVLASFWVIIVIIIVWREK